MHTHAVVHKDVTDLTGPGSGTRTMLNRLLLLVEAV